MHRIQEATFIASCEWGGDSMRERAREIQLFSERKNKKVQIFGKCYNEYRPKPYSIILQQFLIYLMIINTGKKKQSSFFIITGYDCYGQREMY